MSQERLEILEMVANDVVVAAHVELMQEFKDRKSLEWEPDYRIELWQGWDEELTEEGHEEEPAARGHVE